MNKLVKLGILKAVIVLVIGLVLLVGTVLFSEAIGEENISYYCGFTGALIGVGLYRLIVYIRLSKKPEEAKELETNYKDERNTYINHRACSIAFKLCVIGEALGSVIFRMINPLISDVLGVMMGISVFVYLIVYVFVRREN